MRATQNIYYVALLAGILLCGLHAFAPALLAQNGLYILFGVVFTVGLVHGSLDYEIQLTQNSAARLLPFLRNYLLQMALVALVWAIFPLFALMLFLVFTGWHFGETDMAIFRTHAKGWQVFLYGIGLISWILGAHMADTLMYLSDLDVLKRTSTLHTYLADRQTLVLAGSLGALLVAIGTSQLVKKPLHIALVLGILASTAYLPLLPAFTLYFGFWHSLHSLAVIQVDIQKSYQALIVRALPFLVASIVGTFALLGILGYLQMNSVLILFIFISALTLPHAQIMHGTFARFKAQS